MRVLIKSTFHPTSYTFRLDAHRAMSAYANAPGLARWYLSPRQVQRAHRSLCGMDDCYCGGIYRADPPVHEDSHGSYILDATIHRDPS